MRCIDVDKVRPLDEVLGDNIGEFDSGRDKECDKDLDTLIWELGDYENEEPPQDAEEYMEETPIEDELVEKTMIVGRFTDRSQEISPPNAFSSRVMGTAQYGAGEKSSSLSWLSKLPKRFTAASHRSGEKLRFVLRNMRGLPGLRSRSFKSCRKLSDVSGTNPIVRISSPKQTMSPHSSRSRLRKGSNIERSVFLNMMIPPR